MRVVLGGRGRLSGLIWTNWECFKAEFEAVLLYRLNDKFCCKIWIFVLPNANHPPPCVCEDFVGSYVALCVSL